MKKTILADPQTSGGLLVAVKAEAESEMQAILNENNLHEFIIPIGRMVCKKQYFIYSLLSIHLSLYCLFFINVDDKYAYH